MKLGVVLLTILGLSFAAPQVKTPRTLVDDYNAIAAFIPLDQIQVIVLDYIANDAEVQSLATYLQSPEFVDIITAIDNAPEVIQVLTWVQGKGVDIYGLINRIHELLNLPLLVPPTKRAGTSRTVRQMLDEIAALIDEVGLQALLNDLPNTSTEFKELYDMIANEQFHTFVHTILDRPDVQGFLQRLRDLGVRVDESLQTIVTYLGWEHARKHSRLLQDDINEFIALIPIDQIQVILLDYLANDPEVQALLAYAQSPEAVGIVTWVDAQPEFLNLIAYLVANGVDAVTTLNTLHEVLGWPLLTLPTKNAASARTVRQLLDEIGALIDLNALVELYNTKLQTSVDFKALIDQITAPEFHNFILTALDRPDLQSLLNVLRGYGVDVDGAMQFIKDLLGWTKTGTQRTLQDDLNDFLAVIPLDQVEVLFIDYLANDVEVQTILSYLQSPDIIPLVEWVDAQPEYKDLVWYIQGQGVDIVTLINTLHDLLGWPLIPTVPPGRKVESRTLRELLDALAGLIDLTAIEALINDKLVSSPDFKALYDKISGDAFHNFVLAASQRTEVQGLLDLLRSYGADVDGAIAWIKNLLGWI